MRERLRPALDRVRASIGDVRRTGRPVNEADTKRALIAPVLSALGWDMADLSEVRMEYRHTGRHNPVDYALLLQGVPLLFIEAKPLGTNVDDQACQAQAVNYAESAGVAWCVLTDGDKYRVYNARAPVPLAADKLFRAARVSDTGQEEHVLEALELLSREKLPSWAGPPCPDCGAALSPGCPVCTRCGADLAVHWRRRAEAQGAAATWPVKKYDPNQPLGCWWVLVPFGVVLWWLAEWVERVGGRADARRRQEEERRNS
ncbi:MAG: type I restriction endonuclease [bacterium]